MTLLSTSNFLNQKSAISILTALILTTAGLNSVKANAAPIYKVIDNKTGQVTFTDNPQAYEQQANKQISQIAITTGNTSGANSSNTGTNGATANAGNVNNTSNGNQVTRSSAATIPKPTFKAAVNYQLTMLEPSEERAYQRPAQTIIVNLQLRPALQANDSVIIYLDGKEVARGLGASISTVDLLPGEHSIQAVIINEFGQSIKQIHRTIYVIQTTAILQNKRKVAQQMLAYQRLSWQQKMWLKLRQKAAVKQTTTE